MGCYEGNWGWKNWWSKDNTRVGRGSPFRLNEYMGCVRFDKIRTRLKYTDDEPPHYVDFSSTYGIWKRHRIPTYPPTSYHVGSPAWMNQ